MLLWANVYKCKCHGLLEESILIIYSEEKYSNFGLRMFGSPNYRLGAPKTMPQLVSSSFTDEPLVAQQCAINIISYHWFCQVHLH